MPTLPTGIFPPIPTPFDQDERFDRDAFRYNFSLWNQTDLAGYVVLGSNGESVHMTDEEGVECLEAAVEPVARGKLLIAGTGRPSTRQTLEMTRRAARLGYTAALVVPPAYYRSSMRESALEAHYRAIADAAEIPIVLYYVPKFAPVSFSPQLVSGLSAHENIVGIKDTSGDPVFLTRLLRDRADDFRVYAGLGSHLFTGVTLGVDGGILALANVAPRLCTELFSLTRSDELDQARELQGRLLEVNTVITARFGVSGLKHAMGTLGYRAGVARRPLEPLTSQEKGEIDSVFQAAGIATWEDG